MAARFSGMVDAKDRVRGQMRYTADLTLPGMLTARLLRSSFPHARLRSVRVDAARRVPGVRAVVTGADLAARPDLFPYMGPVIRDQPLLAIEKVRFTGEPVAAVVAEDEDAADEAVELLDVDYEPLPAVFDAEEALGERAPLLHEGPPRVGGTFADVVLHLEGGNVCNRFKLRRGDLEAGFAEADEIFEDVFTSPPVQHVSLEAHACLAEVADGRVTVWATTQTPHVLRAQLAEVFRAPISRIRVVVPTLGGAYGGKCYPKIEPLTAVLAMLARRPVRLALSREEEFVTVTKHGMRIRLRTGTTRDGRIVAKQATCLFNTGAYADIGPRLIKNGGFGTTGPYAIPNVRVDSYAVYTNLPPAGAFRGYGISQAAWAYESQMDMIADRLGVDPLELRSRNLLREGDRFATGEPVEDCHFHELLEGAAGAVGWGEGSGPERRGRRVRAKGLSCIIKSTVTPSTSTASVKLNEDGSLNVLTSSVEMGQGLKTALAILAAEQLGLGTADVHVSEVDTDVTPYDQQTSSSRSTHAMGTAVQMAAASVREQSLALAGELLEASPDDLEVADGQVRVKGAPGRSVSFGQVVRRTRSGNILGHARFRSTGGLDPETGQGVASVHWHQAAGAAEVEVDLDTGRVDVLKYAARVYAGRVVNPVQVELQTEGCVAFGVGQAFFEELVFDGGQLQNGSLAEYLVPSLRDMPAELSVAALEDPERREIHGLGETSLPPVMPAIGNAVARATGVRIQDLPITPEKLLRALRGEAGT
jgi:CO/xanthine dehydrogenase Mo-binding subunit